MSSSSNYTRIDRFVLTKNESFSRTSLPSPVSNLFMLTLWCFSEAKHQLLKKLRRFERLAELDPVELETFLLEDEEGELDDNDIDHLKEEECESHNLDRSNNEKDMKQHGIDGNVERVYMRWDLWKEVESSAIDVMAEEDLRAEVDDGWKRNGEERGDIAIEIEVEIFRLLVEEMQTEVDWFIK